MNGLLDLATGISNSECSRHNTVRLVTFQSRDITNKLLSEGLIETLVPFSSNYTPHRLSHVETELQFVKTDAGVIALKDNDKEKYYEVRKSKIKERVYPFYAYKSHNYCGTAHNMSASLIYCLASHFMGAMNFAERDIIELEVPEEYIILERSDCNSVECLLPLIKKEWIVSILKFNRWVSEVCHKENALLYDNIILRDETYRMCYSKDIVFNGHGHGDFLACFESPTMLDRVTDVSIQRDYVQLDIFNIFAQYMYMLRHSLTIKDFKDIKIKHAITELPNLVDFKYIESFNAVMPELLRVMNKQIYPEGSVYKERISLIKDDGFNYDFEDDEADEI